MVAPLSQDPLWLWGALVVACALVLLRWWNGHIRAQSRAQSEAQLTARAVAQMAQDVASLNEAMVQARADARVHAEQGRAQSLEAYAGHVGALEKQLREVLMQTGQQLDGGQAQTRDTLERFNKDLQTQMAAHRAVILDVQGQLGALGEAARGMHELGKDIAGLQDILRAPKLRGNLGELLLAEILRQVLPEDTFALQHRFVGEDGDGPLIVDAVIRLGERLVPIDAKFPLESFQRLLADRATGGDKGAGPDKELRGRKAFLDVLKKHIDVVATKYIRPEAGTYDFALAYIPAENVYYEAIVRGQGKEQMALSTYAAERRVMVVSPSTLYAYLLTVLYGLRGLKIEEQADRIRKDLAAIHKKFASFFSALEKSDKHLRLAQGNHDDAMKRARKLNDQMGRITGEALALGAPPVAARLEASPTGDREGDENQ